MADLALQGNYRFAARAAESNDEEDRREWVVPVDWDEVGRSAHAKAPPIAIAADRGRFTPRPAQTGDC